MVNQKIIDIIVVYSFLFKKKMDKEKQEMKTKVFIIENKQKNIEKIHKRVMINAIESLQKQEGM